MEVPQVPVHHRGEEDTVGEGGGDRRKGRVPEPPVSVCWENFPAVKWGPDRRQVELRGRPAHHEYVGPEAEDKFGQEQGQDKSFYLRVKL